MRNFIMGLALSVGVWCIGVLCMTALVFGISSVNKYFSDDTVTRGHLVSAWLDGSVHNGRGYSFIPVSEDRGIGWLRKLQESVERRIYVEWPMLPRERDNEVAEWLSSQHAYPTLDDQRWFAGRVRDESKWHVGPIVTVPGSPGIHRTRATYMDTYEAPNHGGIYGVTVRMHWDLTIDENTLVVTAEPDLSHSKVQRFAYSNHQLGFVPVGSR